MRLVRNICQITAAGKMYVALVLAALLQCHQTAVAAERHALVIGNSEYAKSALQNPANDATDMAAALEKLGYRVFGEQAHTNVDREQMDSLLNNFTNQLPIDGIALFYFAGHGAKDETQQSYLIPIKTNIQRESQIKYRAIGLSYVADTLKDGNQHGLNILLIDACRDRPFGRSFNRNSARGLSRPSRIPRGTFIGLAAGDGQVAADGDGRNGIYTRYLLDALRHKSDQSIEAVHKSVASAVYNATLGRTDPQRPVYQSDFFGTYCFGDCYQANTKPTLQRKPFQSPAKGRFSLQVTPSRAQVCFWFNEQWRCDREARLPLNREYPVYASASGFMEYQTSTTLTEDNQLLAINLTPRSLPGSNLSTPDRRAAYEPEMISIRGGTFTMGSPESESDRYDNELQHQVKVRNFKLSKYETTFAEYDVFARETARKLPNDWRWGRDKRPVINVSWNDATAYARWLSEKTGKSYRLPTEAEWEYAARAGSNTAYYRGDVIGRNKANCDGCGSQWDNQQTAPAGSFNGNARGLHDMHGNVWEWTCSGYNKNYNGSEQRCESEQSERNRVLRGGSWHDEPSRLRSASRNSYWSAYANYFIGFRLAQDI